MTARAHDNATASRSAASPARTTPAPGLHASPTHPVTLTALGNLAVQDLYRSGAISAKLQVGSPNDPAESAADRTAQQALQGTQPCSCTAGDASPCTACRQQSATTIRRKSKDAAKRAAAKCPRCASARGGRCPRASAAFSSRAWALI